MSAQQVTIEIHLDFATLSQAFLRELMADHNRYELIYDGTTFLIGRDEYGQVTTLRVILAGADTPLPPVFHGELQMRAVILRSTIPRGMKAKAGVYQGANFGLRGGTCRVDPRGEKGSREIRVFGGDFAVVVGLFQRVMTGKLEPGHRGDKWNATVRR